MQVTFDHQVFAQQRFGGISRYFTELAQRLPACGDFDVSVIAPFHQNAYLNATRVPGLISVARLRPGRISIKNGLRWANRLSLPLAWWGRHPDIIHETYFSERVYGRARVRVLTVYDMIHELFAEQVNPKHNSAAAKRAAVARADHIICISECTRRDLVRLLEVDPARTSVVHLGHSLDVAAEEAILPAADPALPVLLYVGERGTYKNFDTLLEAFTTRQLQRRLQLVAFGGRPFNERELRRLRQLGLSAAVRHEQGDDRRLAGWYRSARLFVCPSTYEGFGLPPLEAMAQGCPVACSNQGSVPEIVGNAGEYFDPLNPQQMASAIERVAFDDARHAELRNLGLRRAAGFSWDRCAADTAAVYRRLA